MATFRVYRKSGSGYLGEPKTRLIHADDVLQGIDAAAKKEQGRG